MPTDEMTYLTVLLTTIETQNWRGLEYLLLKEPLVFTTCADRISNSPGLNGMTILHSAMRYGNLPSHLVELIIKLCPEAPSTVDCLGRTPLHIASGTRARLSSIKALVFAYPRACAVQDVDGKVSSYV